MIPTGKLDRRVQFMRGTPIDDGFQTRPASYVDYGSPVWAAKNQISDGERFRADSVFQDMTVRFTVRWSPFSASITSRDRLVCEGAVYGIGGIKEIGRREGIEFTAARLPDDVSA